MITRLFIDLLYKRSVISNSRLAITKVFDLHALKVCNRKEEKLSIMLAYYMVDMEENDLEMILTKHYSLFII